MLQVNQIVLRAGGRVLLDGATMVLDAGERVGLVGRNGTGKSTLLRAILGETGWDSGEIVVPPRWSVATIEQEPPGGPETLLEAVLAADTERARLEAEAETASDPARITDIHTRLADIGAHSAPARAASILAGLGFGQEALETRCETLSGGQRMRIALARVLFRAPDVLLLDEPTNHLDLDAALWLEGFLATYPGSILIVSHDRGLLNTLVKRIVHLHDRRLRSYAGGYDRFERTRREMLARQSAMHTRQQAQIRHLQSFVDRFRYKASKAKQAQSRLKMIERLEPIAAVMEERSIGFDFPKPEPLSPPLVRLETLDAGYGGTPVLKGVDLAIDPDDRIAIVGPNGAGKSTLLKLLAGRLEVMAGKLRKPAKLQIGYFAQHQTEELDPGRTLLEEAAARKPMATEEKLRAHLGRFGFFQERSEVKIGNLSGGEKARGLFALICLEAPHLLLLDEPSNHLDVDSRQALVQGLLAYDGAVVIISHDVHMIEAVADRIWRVADGGCAAYNGDIADYRAELLKSLRGGKAQIASRNGTTGAAGGTGKPKPDGSGDAKARRQEAARQREALAPARKAAAEAEAAMHRLEERKRALEAKFADPALYQDPEADAAALQRALAEVENELAACEERWLEAHEKLEESR